MNYIRERAHFLKHSHRRCVVGVFDKKIQEGSICIGQRAVLSFNRHKSIFLHSVHHGTKVYDRCINSDDKKYILMMRGVMFFQKRRLEIFISLNTRIYVVIEIMFFPKII